MWRLKVWGSPAHVLMNKAGRRRAGGKLGPVTRACLHVGVNPSGPGWLLLDPMTRKEICSSDVVFQEHLNYAHRQNSPPKGLAWVQFDVSEAPAPRGQAEGVDPPEPSDSAKRPSTPSACRASPVSDREGEGQSAGAGAQEGENPESGVPCVLPRQDQAPDVQQPNPVGESTRHVQEPGIMGVPSRAMVGPSGGAWICPRPSCT